MKNLVSLLLICLGCIPLATGQTATGSFLQEPCNNDGIYSVTTTGLSLPITYTYYFDGGSVTHSNVNSATDQLTNIPMGVNGYIYCVAAGSGQTAYAQNSYMPAFTFNINGTNPVCPATLGTIDAVQTSGTPGPFSFVWTNNQTQDVYNGNNASVPEGQYSGLITDQTTGCVLNIQDSAAYIMQESGVTATINTTSANCTNGTATAVPSGGIAPYTFLWANGSTNASITGLSMGYYNLTVTDAQGCHSNYLGAYINQGVQIVVNTSITNATCLESDGSAIAFGSGGVGPYTYNWSNGQTGNTATGLLGTNSYTVIATDANGCIGNGYAYVNSTTPINVTYSSTTSQCTSATGTATLSATGGTQPYSYQWNAFPGVNAAMVSNLAPGTYSFSVTDAVGCIRTGSVVVQPISQLYGSIQGSSVVCPSTNGSASAQIYGGQTPYTYQWSNGSTASSISGVAPGGYSCVITDALGCSVTKYGSVQSVSPLSIGVSTVPVTCMYNTDGSATVAVSGGSAPYVYTNTNSPSSPIASNLGMGSNYIYVTDANGCTGYQYYNIGNSNTSQDCYCTISGDVYVDADNDCTQDVGEQGIANVMIHCEGFGYRFTNSNGHYSFQVPTGTYTITQQVNQYYPLASCQTNNNVVSVVAASGCNTVVDFANVINPLHDLKIVTSNLTVPPIPGMAYQQKVVVSNMGTISENGIQMGYEQDEQIPFVNATLPSFTQLNSATYPYNYSVQSGFPTLDPGESTVMILDYNTPTNIPLGTNLTFLDSVASQAPIDVNWLLDNSPWNNVNTFETTVIGAYDPNYKEVTPKGEGPEGYVTTDVKEFDYTIHFQNEGTYFAQNIVVTDQLDEDFDWTTFKPGYSAYTYTAEISETGLLKFTFPNINLPWKSSYGDMLSSAAVSYSIERKSTTPIGTEFTNTANIYFDFNEPIVTNTTLNTLQDVNSVEDNSTNVTAVQVVLYPVPASDYLSIQVNNVSQSQTAMFSIVDLMGNIIMSEKLNLAEGSTLITKNLNEVMTGSYLTHIVLENGTSIVKPIVLYRK